MIGAGRFMAEDLQLLSVEAILFDLDGTLVETNNRWAGVIADKLTPLRRVFPGLDTVAWGRRIVMAIEMPSNYVVSICEHLGVGSDFFGLADRFRRSKGLATKTGALAVEGTPELLEALADHFKLAVVTTRARPEARSFLEGLGYERFFPVVITRQDTFRMKPHPEPVRTAARLLGVAPSRCLLVGDTVMDIRAAKRAGTIAVGVLSGFGERQELERAGAHLILDRAAQLLDYLSLPGKVAQAQAREGTTPALE